MTIQLPITGRPIALQSAPNVRAWQRDTFERGLLPVIGITGGRGKSTVARMVDAILQQSHLRTAIWTNLGVELRGRRQRGEISGWSLALSRLADTTIDLAIQELHWSTVNAVGLPPASYPVLAITNGSHGTPEAHRGSLRVAAAVHMHGLLVVSGDDHALVDAAHAAGSMLVITSLAKDAPLLRQHLAAGGSAVWIVDDEIRCGEEDDFQTICQTTDLRCGYGGTVQFELANALTAIAIACAIGIDARTVTEAITRFETSADILPGSFNVYEVETWRVVVDGLVPSWHLRTLLRSVNPGSRRRQITVVGDLDTIPGHDVREVGRLLGRHAGAIVLHSNKDYRRVDAFRRGIAANDYPPVMIHLPTERRALNRALKTVRPDDVVLILTNADPGPATRAVTRLLVPPAI